MQRRARTRSLPSTRVEIAFVGDTVNALEGDAKYEGPAAGKYATRSRGSNEAEDGIFKAKAELTAAFGEESAPGTVSGTVTDFVDEDGRSAW